MRIETEPTTAQAHDGTTVHGAIVRRIEETWRSDGELWLTEDRTRLVTDGNSLEASQSLVHPKHEIPLSLAEQWGLTGKPPANE